MTFTQIINIILTLLLPIMISFAWWLSYFLVEKLPLHQRAALEQFAKMAVQKTEQQNKPSPQKKVLATAIVVDLFKAFKLPVLPLEVIDTAIESAVFELDKARPE